MGRSPADLKLVFSSLVNAGLWNSDPSTLPIPWRESHEKLPEKLVFGWANGDGHVQPWPPVQRAMHEVREALEAAGHEVVEWVPPEWYEYNTQMGSVRFSSPLASRESCADATCWKLFHVDSHLDSKWS